MRRLMVVAALFALAIMAGCSQSSQASPESNSEEQADAKASQETDADKQSAIESLDESELDKQASSNTGNSNPSANMDEKGIVPGSISIPAIGVEANVTKVGKLSNGQMGVPKTSKDVGWYEFGAKPGEKGSSVLAGHVDNTKGPAVFFKLEDMKEGDLVYITNDKGKKLTFEVYKTKSYPKDSAPVNKVFGYTAARTIKLITCTGEFLDDVGTHENRLVVSAQLVENG